MVALAQYKKELAVALLAEGVGRNLSGAELKRMAHKSPSSRRAWVEIVA